MSTTFQIIRGSIEPQLAISLQTADGEPVNLTGATNVRLSVARSFNTTQVDLAISKDLIVVDEDEGSLLAAWIEGDTDVSPACYKAQVDYDTASGPVKIGLDFYFEILPNVEALA